MTWHPGTVLENPYGYETFTVLDVDSDMLRLCHRRMSGGAGSYEVSLLAPHEVFFRGIHPGRRPRRGVRLRLVPLDQIDVDRLPINPATFECALAVRDPRVRIPPVKLTQLHAGRFRLRDGRHRFAAHKLLGFTHILAWISVERRPPAEGDAGG